ncbi:MAG TPA: DUF6794 domain-containing protein [Polyangia bacterium]|jgi:Uncharacterized protein conserved in bacteria|nr:DUF6794 domain-containing protein [Polyangia bacterium]
MNVAGTLALVLAAGLAAAPARVGEVVFDFKCLAGDCGSGFGKASWTVGSQDSKDKRTYEGYFRDGQPNGYGKLVFLATGCVHFGEFKNGREDGFGTLRWPTGEGFTGPWKEGKPAGTGLEHSRKNDLTIRGNADDPGLTMLANGELERNDIYGLTPTKDAASPTGVLIPEDLDACFKELKSTLTPEFIAKIKQGTEADTIHYHHDLGMWMRNNWGLWHGSRLATWLLAKGVHHPDDMSGIILRSYWRHLRGKPIQLEKQIADSNKGGKKMYGTDQKSSQPARPQRPSRPAE